VPKSVPNYNHSEYREQLNFLDIYFARSLLPWKCKISRKCSSKNKFSVKVWMKTSLFSNSALSNLSSFFDDEIDLEIPLFWAFLPVFVYFEFALFLRKFRVERYSASLSMSVFETALEKIELLFWRSLNWCLWIFRNVNKQNITLAQWIELKDLAELVIDCIFRLQMRCRHPNSKLPRFKKLEL